MFDVILQSGDFYLSKLYGKKVELPRKTVSTFPLKNFIHIFLIDYCLVIYNDKILSKPKRSVKRYILMTKVLQIQLITLFRPENVFELNSILKTKKKKWKIKIPINFTVWRHFRRAVPKVMDLRWVLMSQMAALHQMKAMDSQWNLISMFF